ncbi:unnamed protein product [Urochloa decumbens]|uniref:Uncharacterized protein n=1 Tax=Urochloa decumbens TaxID=240449 RepID=A0ABC8XND0_9POAL
MGKTIRPADERKLKNKNRTPSQVSGSEWQDVAGVGATSTWAGEKKAKILPADKTARDDAINDECQIEGFDWSADDLRIATDRCVKQLNHRLPDYDDEDFWALNDEDQLQELKIRLALHRIRAHEGERLKGLDKAEVAAMYPPSALEDQGYYKWCERNFDWYFDPEFCEHAGFEDYQRLVLRNNGEYEQWDETKGIENALSASSHLWDKLERLVFYQAVKIAADFNNIFTPLIYSGFTEYMWTIQFVNTRYKDLTCFYLEIWKRVAKQKMNVKEALKQVFDNGVPPSCNIEMQVELKSQHLVTPSPVTYNYETYLADIDEKVSEEKAQMLIRKAVEIFDPRRKTYYDYAKKKLDIAEKIGLIVPSSPHKKALRGRQARCHCIRLAGQGRPQAVA